MRTTFSNDMFRDQTRPTISWSSSGLRFLPFLPVLRHLLSVRGNNSWQRCWAQGGCPIITVAITTGNGTKTTQLCPWTRRLWGCVKKWKLSSTRFCKWCSVEQKYLSKATWSKRSGKQKSRFKVASSVLYITRLLHVFKQDLLSEILKEVKTHHYETICRCSKDLLIESCWMKNTRAEEEN